MKRTLAILLPILAAITLTSVLVVLTRTGSWPASIKPLDWRHMLGTRGDETVNPPTESAEAAGEATV